MPVREHNYKGPCLEGIQGYRPAARPEAALCLLGKVSAKHQSQYSYFKFNLIRCHLFFLLDSLHNKVKAYRIHCYTFLACKKHFDIVALTQEDRLVLLKFYKVLVENIKSEAVVGRLVQAGILTHEEKNSINLAPRNPDRMKALLALLPRKSTHALNAFCEAIKYRHTTIYDQLCKARQQAQSKPGKYPLKLSPKMTILVFCCTILTQRV